MAYAPAVTDGPVFDALVTRCIAVGTELTFRFYPQTDTNLSQSGTTVSFLLAVSLQAGTLLRLVINDALSTMTLAGREQGAPSWNAVSASSVSITYATFSTLYITMQGSLPVTAIGLVNGGNEPIFPACLPSQYSVRAVSSDLNTNFVYFDTEIAAPIPKNWEQAWQSMRAEIAWAQNALANYDTLVTPAEDLLAVRLLPGQLVPFAFRPYVPNSGVWALLVTSAVPARTSMNIWANDWSARGANPWYTWNAGAYDIPAGAVLTFTGLGGGNTPGVSVGTVTKELGYDDEVPIYALTAYYGNGLAITGTYTAVYYDIIPPDLVLGVSIRDGLWPACASIIVAVPSCSRVPARSEFLTLAMWTNATPLIRWLSQPLPTSFPVSKSPCPYTEPCCSKPSPCLSVKSHH